MSDIASVADEPLTRAQIHMGEPKANRCSTRSIWWPDTFPA